MDRQMQVVRAHRGADKKVLPPKNHHVVECRELQEIRRRYGVYRTEALEEVLMFMEKNEE